MSAAESLPMQLDDSVQPVETSPAKDVDGIPYCRKHHSRMTIASGGKKNGATVYYKCPVPNCDQKQQIIKTKNPGVVPPQPLPCPRCNRGKTPVICERDEKCSTPASVILKCPECGWKSSAMAVPQLAAAHFAQRERGPKPPIEEIGRR